jgi:hypothetical protein
VAAAGSTSGSGAGTDAAMPDVASGDGGPHLAGGDGGGADGAPQSLVQPIQRGNLHVLEFGNIKFTVDGTQGARITGFALDGTNILIGPQQVSAMFAPFWGSTFWTSPQADWWPNLVVPLDSGQYTMSVGADSTVTAKSAVGMVKKKPVVVTKRFAVDPTGAVTIEYTMTNTGTASFQIGHWEVTRVGPNGLTFYPAGTAAPTIPFGTIMVKKIGAYQWFDHSTYPMGTASKISDFPTGGWVAHVVPDPAGDILFIKTFPDIPRGSGAAGDGELEIFAQSDRSYVEIEAKNQQVMIAPNESVPWQVKWYLRRLPAGTMRTAGNQALVDFVLKQIH